MHRKDFLILTLRVDDMLVVRPNIEKINDLKKKLASRFSMKDLDETKQFLGICKISKILKARSYCYLKKNTLRRC